MRGFYILIIVFVFTSCNQEEKISVGYNNYNIFLNDSLKTVKSKIKNLTKDINSNNEGAFESFFSPDEPQAYTKSTVLSPILFLTFNNKKLVKVNITFLDNNTLKREFNYSEILRELSRNYINIDDLLDENDLSYSNKKYVKRIKIDTTSVFNKINYEIKLIP